MSYKRIHRSYPRTILAKACDDCGVPEGMCAEGWPFFGESQTDINGAPLNLLFSIPSFKFDGVSMVPELNYVEALTNCGMISCWGLTPQILSFPNNELDNFDILEYSINIIEPVFKYTIRFTMSWRDYSKPQLPKSSITYKSENYDSWVERTSFSFSKTHTQEAPCAVDVSANFPLGASRLPFPANTIISGIINKSEIQSADEEMIRRYFPSGLLGAPDSIDIWIRLSGEEICADPCLTGTQYDRRRCSHGVIYRRGISECEKPCRLTSDAKGTGWRIEQDEGGLPESWHYLGPNGMGEIVGGSVVIGPGGGHVGECIIATSGLCASIGGIWESDYCCPSPSGCLEPCRLLIAYSGTDGMGGVVSGDSGDCVNVSSGVCAAVTGEWLSAYCCPSPSPSVPPPPPPPPPPPSPCLCDGTDVETDPNMAMVTVCNAGNAADTTGYGAVDYSYQIGKYEVTGSQYAAFLNAVASTDTYGLYHASMATNDRAAQISRTLSYPNSVPTYSYSVFNNTGNVPIAWVSWWNCARFCNWISNGRPSGAQIATTTENGAYNVNGALPHVEEGDYISPNTINPNTGLAPKYRMPTENEWYKAAYFDPSKSGGAGYWTYATMSEDYTTSTIGETSSAIDVGTKSASYYGTYDQSGNVWETIDPNEDHTAVLMRGGRYFGHQGYLGKVISRFDIATTTVDSTQGFRVASSSSCMAPSVPPSPSSTPSPSVSPPVALVTTFNVDGYGAGVYGGSGVHSALNCVQAGDYIFFDDQYVYQLSMDNAGMVTYEYSIVGGMSNSFVIASGDNKLFFYDSAVGVASGAVYSVIVRASDTANSSSYIDTEVFIPICSG